MEQTKLTMDRNTRRIKSGCYLTNVTMAAVCNLSPLLFLTFRGMYGISYTLLGLLVAINFVTQLLIDLAFSFFSHKFDIPKTIKVMPVLAVVGFVLYALSPFIFEGVNVYIGLVIGTMIFSSASGLAEVLLSPIFAALPSDNPDRDMSKLHSTYAWGTVGLVIVVTVFLQFFREQWFVLPLLFMLMPLTASILFAGTEIPKMETPEKASGALSYFKDGKLWLCVIAIFFGGASECTMAQWASGFLEGSLGIEKVWGDVFGVAMFAVTLGIGRSLYAKYGKNIRKVLLLCGVGATACYLVSALSPSPIVALVACALTGLCTSMMWPGSLVIAADIFPTSGVFIYAMMAAGGDLGASIGPQMVGAIADGVAASPAFAGLAQSLAITTEQLGLKLGLLCGAVFPLLSIIVFLLHIRLHKKQSQALPLQEMKK